MTTLTDQHREVYGTMAEFDSASALLAATREAHRAGYRRMDAYTPFPVDGLAEALGRRYTGIPTLVLLSGIAGGVAGFALQYYTSVIDYPLNIGGRPLNSWPAFIPAMFETTVLAAALAAVIGMIVMNGLPMPYHPVFNVPRFAHATRDGFFLCIQSKDPNFDRQAAHEFLTRMNPREVNDVPH
jgi:hypothetical protein